MSFDGITEFVAVADCLSFTKAAKELNVSAAHVSRKIHFLESKLKVKPFSEHCITVNKVIAAYITSKSVR